METNNRTKSLAIDCDGDGRIYTGSYRKSRCVSVYVRGVSNLVFGLKMEFIPFVVGVTVVVIVVACNVLGYGYIYGRTITTIHFNIQFDSLNYGYRLFESKGPIVFRTLYARIHSSTMCARCGLDGGIFDALRYTYLYVLILLFIWRRWMKGIDGSWRVWEEERESNVHCIGLACMKTRTYGAPTRDSYPYRKFPI